jgi:hypothetical protein
MNEFVDLKDDYNRALRVRRFKRALALVCVGAAALLLALGMGSLIATAESPAVCAAGIIILLAGVWGTHHLSTRH